MRSKINTAFNVARKVALGLLVGCAVACNSFDKPADIPIPQEPPQLFVECYLEDGRPPLLALSLTQSFFAPVGLVPVSNATVELTAPGGQRIALQNGIFPDMGLRKLYNWAAPGTTIRLQAGDVWQLTITDSAGRRLTAQTRVMPKVPIDSVTYAARDNDTTAYCAAWVQDPPGQANFYRIVVNADSANGGAATDYSTEDNFRNGQSAPIRTGYTVALGDTVFLRLFSIEQSYYQFLESVQAAQRNNGNPFAQPNALRSTVQGGLGVFTAMVYDERRFRIRERRGKVL